MKIIEAISWIKQPGIMFALPQDPHTQEAIKVLLKTAEKEIERPNTYDVNKVVEQISKISELARPVGWLGKEEIVRTKEVIEIVKRGGEI